MAISAHVWDLWCFEVQDCLLYCSLQIYHLSWIYLLKFFCLFEDLEIDMDRVALFKIRLILFKFSPSILFLTCVYNVYSMVWGFIDRSTPRREHWAASPGWKGERKDRLPVAKSSSCVCDWACTCKREHTHACVNECVCVHVCTLQMCLHV